MEPNNKIIYFRLAQYAQKVFAQLSSIEVKTYTAAELGKFMKKDLYSKYVCNTPTARQFRNALDKFSDADLAECNITEESFECTVNGQSVWLALSEFEKLAKVPKIEQVKFVAVSKSSVVYRAAATLPKDAGIVKNYVDTNKNTCRPHLRWAYLDFKNGWLWASDALKFYAGRVTDATLIEGDAERLAVPSGIATKCAGKTVTLTYYEDGTVECFDGEKSVTETMEKHHFISLLDYKKVVPKVSTTAKVTLTKDSIATLKSFIKTTKSDKYESLITFQTCRSQLLVSCKEADSDHQYKISLDLTAECICDVTISFDSKELSQLAADFNGEIWLDGSNRPIIFEAKCKDNFLMLMSAKEGTDSATITKTTDYLTLKTEKIMAKKIVETPLMKQHAEMKQRHPDAILLFRVGDFYETFKEDAVAVSEILGVTLTRRAIGQGEYVELAGFPAVSLDHYLPKLIRSGKRVAICESIEGEQKISEEVKAEVEKVQAEPAEEEAQAEAPEETPVEEVQVEEEVPEDEAPQVEEEVPAETPEPEPTPEPETKFLKDELRECALAQLPDGAEIVKADFIPIGDNNGKWKLILKMGDVYRYADIVAAARFLYVCDRVFNTAKDVADLMGMSLSKPAPGPATIEEMTKIFIDEYGFEEFAAKLHAEDCFKLYRYLVENKSWTFSFRKKDGSERIAHGTLHSDMIPEVKDKSTLNAKFQNYYDLDKKAWRCFEKANLLNINVQK